MQNFNINLEVNHAIFNRIGLKFHMLAATMSGEFSRDASKRIAEFILRKAKKLVPVRTGRLKKSGRVVMTPDRKSYTVRFGTSKIRYAAVVEYGRTAFAPMRPQPYLRPAAQMARRKMKSVPQEVFNKKFRKMFPRIMV
tara:strand:+ start:546 stop:962 length:417 start_codon:yes stop_codon:yes gene_type:complete